MIEWVVIISLVAAMVLLLWLVRNLFKTLANIQIRLEELYFFVENYDEFVQKLNASETYYGDATIEAFVKMSNELNVHLKDILDLQAELTGDLDAEKETEA